VGVTVAKTAKNWEFDFNEKVIQDHNIRFPSFSSMLRTEQTKAEISFLV
jgi:hypothetical protein